MFIGRHEEQDKTATESRRPDHFPYDSKQGSDIYALVREVFSNGDYESNSPINYVKAVMLFAVSHLWAFHSAWIGTLWTLSRRVPWNHWMGKLTDDSLQQHHSFHIFIGLLIHSLHYWIPPWPMHRCQILVCYHMGNDSGSPWLSGSLILFLMSSNEHCSLFPILVCCLQRCDVIW